MASKIIQQIRIRHAGDFIVDTLPPVGSVVINDGDGFTKNPTVSLKLDAVDETTDVKDLDIRNVDIFTNVVDTHIKNLRKKLGKSGNIIKTIYGSGYRIQDEETDA